VKVTDMYGDGRVEVTHGHFTKILNVHHVGFNVLDATNAIQIFETCATRENLDAASKLMGSPPEAILGIMLSIFRDRVRSAKILTLLEGMCMQRTVSLVNGGARQRTKVHYDDQLSDEDYANGSPAFQDDAKERGLTPTGLFDQLDDAAEPKKRKRATASGSSSTTVARALLDLGLDVPTHGSNRQRQVCVDCPPGDKKLAIYPDVDGKKCKLCTVCARIADTWYQRTDSRRLGKALD